MTKTSLHVPTGLAFRQGYGLYSSDVSKFRADLRLYWLQLPSWSSSIPPYTCRYLALVIPQQFI